MTEHRASCRCGKLTAVATGDPVRVSVCHCRNCQKRTGSAFAVQARWPGDRVTITGTSGSFEKVGHRRSLVISTVCLATLVKLDVSGRALEEVRLCLGGIGPVPVRLRDVERFLTSGPLTASRLEQAAELPTALVRSRSRQDYRRDVVRGFMLRGLFNAARRAGADPTLFTPEMEAACA